jgi:catechol 2,3-dioxygenase-like lactoylglutathione lyase family enzyme
MGALGLGHVAVGVRDVDKSLGFYRDVLGLEVYLDRVEDLATVGRRRRAAYLRNQYEPYSTFIVLDQSLTEDPFGSATELWGIGVHHFAFWTSGVEDVVGRARSAGFEVVFGPHDSDSSAWAEPPGTVIRTALLKDPDGNIVQLDQREG